MVSQLLVIFYAETERIQGFSQISHSFSLHRSAKTRSLPETATLGQSKHYRLVTDCIYPAIRILVNMQAFRYPIF
jgi:hypothetical protein